jgi:hypothetical protein
MLEHCLHSPGDNEKLKPYSGGALLSTEGDASPDLGWHVEAMSNPQMQGSISRQSRIDLEARGYVHSTNIE